MSVETDPTAPLPTPDTSPEQEPSQQTSPRESSFVRMRKEKERLEKELRSLKERNSITESLKTAGLEGDAWVEGRQMPDILSSFARQMKDSLEADMEVKLESRFKQYKQDHLFEYMQAATSSDYARVVSDASIRKLLKAEPEMEVVLEALKDQPEKYAQVMYRKCARMAAEEKSMAENKARLDLAASRPGRRYAQPSAAPVEEEFSVYNMQPGDTRAYEYIKSLQRQIRF